MTTWVCTDAGMYSCPMGTQDYYGSIRCADGMARQCMKRYVCMIIRYLCPMGAQDYAVKFVGTLAKGDYQFVHYYMKT